MTNKRDIKEEFSTESVQGWKRKTLVIGSQIEEKKLSLLKSDIIFLTMTDLACLL